MKRRLYPAVLERGPRGTLGAWFPDFPGCVAGGKSQEEAIEKATGEFEKAVATAGLPVFPIVRVEAVNDDEDEDE